MNLLAWLKQLLRPKPPPPVVVPVPVTPPDLSTASLFALINAERAKYNIPPLAISARLAFVAQSQADWMAAHNNLTHDLPSPMPARVKASGYAYTLAAENIGEDYTDNAAAVAGWMGSPEHRINILNPLLIDAGVGIAASASGGGGGGVYFCQTFGATR